MKRAVFFVGLAFVLISFAFRFETTYQKGYFDFVHRLEANQQSLYRMAAATDFSQSAAREALLDSVTAARGLLKAGDFWLRYLDPVQYLGINGQLPVEWETEVFEKFEKPYRRQGAGISLAQMALLEPHPEKDTVLRYLASSIAATRAFYADSNTRQIIRPEHFFYANRLYLLNLAAIYTSGYECPDKKFLVPELRAMMQAVSRIYDWHDESFSGSVLTAAYRDAYAKALVFVNQQQNDYEQFDYFHFIKDHVNVLFRLNQEMIRHYGFYSSSLVDYTLSDSVNSIFDKQLFSGQEWKGIYSFVDDPQVLQQMRNIGELLFNDPILSGNTARSCASCHRPDMAFTDTTRGTSLLMDRKSAHERNAPSLLNVLHNHLLMQDGKHLTMQEQGRVVMANPIEMAGDLKTILANVMSCTEYKTAFREWMKYTPEEKKPTIDHISSAISIYLHDFNVGYSPFDNAMNIGAPIDTGVVHGFNVFMGKANCASCHFIPYFNGIKPPYVNSEFEVLGVPEDMHYTRLSRDSGRYKVHPVPEMLAAFRTPTIRNSSFTAPYMHNGILKTMEEVIDFYDKGGGVGHGLVVPSQTLATDSLHLTAGEIQSLLTFMRSLDERLPAIKQPASLPSSSRKALNQRKVGGVY